LVLTICGSKIWEDLRFVDVRETIKFKIILGSQLEIIKQSFL